MKVSELIEILNKHDHEILVSLGGFANKSHARSVIKDVQYSDVIDALVFIDGKYCGRSGGESPVDMSRRLIIQVS